MNRFQGIVDLREALGGRRFIMCMGCAGINTALFAAGTLSESGYLAILGGTVFGYIANNLMQRIKTPEGQP